MYLRWLTSTRRSESTSSYPSDESPSSTVVPDEHEEHCQPPSAKAEPSTGLIVIRTPMFILPGRSMVVGASAPLELRTSEIHHCEDDQSPTIVAPVAGTTLIAPPRSRLYVNPTEALGLPFRKGWRKIPDEIRVFILKHNLVFNQPINYRHATGSLERPGVEGLRPHLWLGCALAHFSMGFEIAYLAREIFYAHNVFILHTKFRGLVHPKLPDTNFIRYLNITMDVETHLLVSLKKVADGTLGFRGLRFVQINLSWGCFSCPSTEDWLTVIKPLTFRCKGMYTIQHLEDYKKRCLLSRKEDFSESLVVESLHIEKDASSTSASREGCKAIPVFKAVQLPSNAELSVIPGKLRSAVSMGNLVKFLFWPSLGALLAWIYFTLLV